MNEDVLMHDNKTVSMNRPAFSRHLIPLQLGVLRRTHGTTIYRRI